MTTFRLGGRAFDARPLWLALAVPALAGIATLVGAPLALTRDAEWWRFWTGLFVHASGWHLLFDAGAAAVLLACIRPRLTLLLLPPAVGAGALLLRPELSSYCGLSGVLHGLAVIAAIDLARSNKGWRRSLVLAVCVSVFAKAILETLIGAPLFTQGFDMGGAVVCEAHLVGAVTGLAIVWPRKKPSPDGHRDPTV